MSDTANDNQEPLRTVLRPVRLGRIVATTRRIGCLHAHLHAAVPRAACQRRLGLRVQGGRRQQRSTPSRTADASSHPIPSTPPSRARASATTPSGSSPKATAARPPSFFRANIKRGGHAPEIHRHRRQALSLARHRAATAGAMPRSCSWPRPRSRRCSNCTRISARSPNAPQPPVISNRPCFPFSTPRPGREPVRDGSLPSFNPAFQPKEFEP